MTRIVREVIDLNRYIDAHSTDGCHWHTSCITCPFDECRIDIPLRKPRAVAVRERYESIAEFARSNPDLSMKAIAGVFGVSDRTVYRALDTVGS